jgi:hypothetical protein
MVGKIFAYEVFFCRRPSPFLVNAVADIAFDELKRTTALATCTARIFAIVTSCGQTGRAYARRERVERFT